jgi:hypothetical protein
VGHVLKLSKTLRRKVFGHGTVICFLRYSFD